MRINFEVYMIRTVLIWRCLKGTINDQKVEKDCVKQGKM